MTVTSLCKGSVLVLLVWQSAAQGEPLGAEFTFQGQLAQNGAPVTAGSADFIFELRNAEVGGSLVMVPAPLQNPLEALDVELSATGALFTVELDFGAEAFNGQARWLAVSFRTPAGSGSYTPFDQRVLLTGTPYALRSLASQWENNSTDDIYFPAGPVGCCEVSDCCTPHLDPGCSNASCETEVCGLKNSCCTNAWGQACVDLAEANCICGDRLVGIGTDSPTEELDVAGNIKTTGTIQSGGSIIVDGSPGNERISSTGSLDIYSAGNRVLRLEGEVSGPSLTGANVLGGWHGNSIAPAVVGATICGGGGVDILGGEASNLVTGTFGTIGGGSGNTAGGSSATVGGGGANTAGGGLSVVGGGSGNAASNTWSTVDGGSGNMASGQFSSVGGGSGNTASGFISNVGGGIGNSASGDWSTVGGGNGNMASGEFSTVAGGSSNTASGDKSLAAGRRAKANHSGSFVWADDTEADFASSGANQFLVRASGGVGIGMTNPTFQLQLSANSAAKPTSNTWTIASDRRLKKNVEPIEGSLVKLLRLRGVTYQWIDPASQGGMDGTYTGMIAQDVEPVFPEWVSGGPDGYKSLTVIGFEALAIEALRDLRAEKDAQVNMLRAECASQIHTLRIEKDAEIAELNGRLERVEAMLAPGDNHKTRGAQ